MKKLIAICLLLAAGIAQAQFVPFQPNQILTAQTLNAAFGNFLPINGSTPITLPQLTVSGATTLNTLTVGGATIFTGPVAFPSGVTCSGTPTSSFATYNGIVTHC